MNDIAELRQHMFDTLRGLRDKDNPMDLDRAKAVSDVARTIIDSARVEVDYLRATGETRGTGFIAIDPPKPAEPGIAVRKNGVQILQDDSNGKTTVTERNGMTITRHVAR